MQNGKGGTQSVFLFSPESPTVSTPGSMPGSARDSTHGGAARASSGDTQCGTTAGTPGHCCQLKEKNKQTKKTSLWISRELRLAKNLHSCHLRLHSSPRLGVKATPTELDLACELLHEEGKKTKNTRGFPSDTSAYAKILFLWNLLISLSHQGGDGDSMRLRWGFWLTKWQASWSKMAVKHRGWGHVVTGREQRCPLNVLFSICSIIIFFTWESQIPDSTSNWRMLSFWR